MLPTRSGTLAEAKLALQIVKLDLPTLPSLVFHKKFTTLQLTGWCIFCPPGNRTWISVVEHYCAAYKLGQEDTVSTAILQQSIPNIKLLECHPVVISLPWSNATYFFPLIPIHISLNRANSNTELKPHSLHVLIEHQDNYH